MNKPLRSCIAGAVSMAMVAGCATGGAPRYTVTPPQNVKPRTLDQGRAYADTARGAYQKDIDRELITTGNVGTALIILGGAVAGLAGLKAHPDTILVTTLAGGTAYGVANWNSAAGRAPVYQKGIEAIDCAVNVLGPLDIATEKFTSFQTALTDLEMSAPAVQTSIAATKSMLAGLVPRGLNKAHEDRAKAVIAAAEAGVQGSIDAIDTGRQLELKIDGANVQLETFVKRVDGKVQKLVIERSPDLSVIKSMIAGIGTWATFFKPGGGLSDDVKQKMDAAGKTQGKRAATPGAVTPQEEAALESQVDALEKASGTVIFNSARVRSYVKAINLAAVDKAMLDCDLPAGSLPLRTVPDVLTFSGAVGQALPIHVTGGKPKYGGSISGDSFSVSTPASGGGLLVTATKALTPGARFFLTISDSADPKPQEVTMEIVVAGTAPPPPDPAADPKPTLQTIASALEGKSVVIDGTQATVAGKPAIEQDQMTVNVTCSPPKPDKPLGSTAVRDKLIEGLGETAKAFLADGSGKEKIVVTGAEGCVAKAQGRRGGKPATTRRRD